MRGFLHFQSSLGPRLVSVEEVVEVIPMVELQRETTDNQRFCGLFNYRGQVVPVFDLSDAAPEHFMDIQSFLIVTRHEERGVAILAQEVNRIVDIHDGDITKVTPQGMSGFSVAKLGDEMIRVVQPQELLEL